LTSGDLKTLNPKPSFIGGVAKEYVTDLGCEKYFLRVTY
jgi:hypothetical protein